MTALILTSPERETLRAHIITGTTMVQYGDRRVQYGSVDEMIKLWEYCNAVEASVAASGGLGAQRRSFVTFSRR